MDKCEFENCGKLLVNKGLQAKTFVVEGKKYCYLCHLKVKKDIEFNKLTPCDFHKCQMKLNKYQIKLLDGKNYCLNHWRILEKQQRRLNPKNLEDHLTEIKNKEDRLKLVKINKHYKILRRDILEKKLRHRIFNHEDSTEEQEELYSFELFKLDEKTQQYINEILYKNDPKCLICKDFIQEDEKYCKDCSNLYEFNPVVEPKKEEIPIVEEVKEDPKKEEIPIVEEVKISNVKQRKNKSNKDEYYTCCCGSEITEKGRWQHEKSSKHKKFINSK